MFEIEAKNNKEHFVSVALNLGVSLNTAETIGAQKEESFLEGAEFAYNKANEWHNVAEGDLPKEKKEYCCKVFYYESEKTFNAFLWFNPETKDFNFLKEIEEGNESIFKVKAWCEIPRYIEK